MKKSEVERFSPLVSVFVILPLVLGLAACSTGTSPSATETTNNTVPAGNPTSSTNLTSENENVVITFSYNDYNRSIFEPLMEEFHQENPSITVQFVPYEPYDSEKIKTTDDYIRSLAISADSTIISGRTSAVGDYFLDQQSLLDADASFNQKDLWPGSLSACEGSQGQVLGIPLNFFFYGIFYDKAAFDAASLAYPQPGWTWDDFQQDLRALTQTQDGVTRFGYADRSYQSILQPLIGNNLAKNDGKIDSKTLSTDLKWYVDQAKAGALLPFQGVADVDQQQPAAERWNALFQNNNAPAMWYGSLVEAVPGSSGYEESDLAVSTFGIAPFPVSADGKHVNTTPLSADCAVISAGTLHPQETWKWVSFLSQHLKNRYKSQIYGKFVIPARQSIAEEIGFWNNLSEDNQAAFRYGLEHAWFPGLYADSENAVLAAVEKASVGEEDLTSVLSEAESQQPAHSQTESNTQPIIVATPKSISPTAKTIKFYSSSISSQEINSFKSLIKSFNQDHSGEIEVEMPESNPLTGNEEYYTGMSKNVDCFIAETDPAGAAASGVILDLNPLFEGEESSFQQDYDTALLNASKYEGGLYDLPFTSQPPIIVYNADLLAKRGLQPPSIDWTFDEFLQKITAVSSVTGADKSYGFMLDSPSVSTTDMLYAGRNVQWLDTIGTLPVAKFDTPEMVDTLNWFAEMYKSGVFFEPASGDDWWPSMTRAIQAGQIAVWTARAGEQEEHFSGAAPTYKIGIAPLPKLKNSNVSYGSIAERGFYISSSSPNPQACWLWAKYLSENSAVFNGVPARKSVANSPAWEAAVGSENAAVYRAALANSQSEAEETLSPYLLFPLKDWLFQADQNVRKGNDAKQELVLAQQKADAYQACMTAVDISNLNNTELYAEVLICAKKADPSWQ
jgi:ABC-type glycerol-3-phosphate transport system substrate-binding protein